MFLKQPRFLQLYIGGKNRIGTIVSEIRPIVAFVYQHKRLQESESLVKTLRNRVHPLQLQTEQFFLTLYFLRATYVIFYANQNVDNLKTPFRGNPGK